MSNLELKGFRGLRSLNNLINETKTTSSSQTIKNFRVESLIPGKYQPRKKINEDTLVELSESIKSQGIIQPIIIRKIADDDKYEIVAGERRWQAAKRVGLKEVPVIIREIEDNVALAFALIENIQRENLNPIEEAMAFQKFNEEFSLTHADIAQMVGRARVTITNTMRLLTLHNSVKEMLINGVIDKGHAKELITLSQEDQIFIANKIAKENLSVREVEDIIKNIKNNKKIAIEMGGADNIYNEKCSHWSIELASLLSSNVRIKLNKKGQGSITIQIDKPEKIELLLEKLKK